MARSLVQALEGIDFPCDRRRIVDFARRNDIGSRSLNLLEQLPERQYQSMTELFTALPSKAQRRGGSRPSPEPERQAAAEPAKGEKPSAEKPPAQKAEPPKGPAIRKPETPEKAATPPPLPKSLPDTPMAALQGNPMQSMLQAQRLWIDWMNGSAEMMRKLWMPWLR